MDATKNYTVLEGDDPTYGDRVNADVGLKPGHLVMHKPTKSAVGRNCTYYNIGGPLEFPDLMDDAIVWVDGQSLGQLDFFKFQNSKDLRKPWPSKRVTFKEIPGTGRLQSKSCSIRGLENIVLRGRNTQHLAHEHWGKSGNNFLTGNFGFDCQGFVLSTIDGGTIDLDGIEGRHGFAPLRIQPEDGFPITLKEVTITNSYMHSTLRGEGIYLNSTQKPPTPRTKKLTIKNLVLAETAAELLQSQNANGSDISDVNAFAGATAWPYGFQNYQASGMQDHLNGGINTRRNLLFDGCGVAGYMPYSVSPEEWTPELINEMRMQNCAFLGGRGIGMYANNVCSNGITWIFDGVYFGLFNDDFYKHTGNKPNPFYLTTGISRKDQIIIRKLFHDGSKSRMFDYPDKFTVEENAIQQIAMAFPKYRNSGFHESSLMVMQYKEMYAPWFDGPDGTATQWLPGMIVSEIEESPEKVLTKYEHYKVLNPFAAQPGIAPSENENCVHVTWDKYGVRSDQPNWSQLTEQSEIPPHDFRQKDDSQFKSMGIQYPPEQEPITGSYFEGNSRITTVGSRIYKEDLSGAKV